MLSSLQLPGAVVVVVVGTAVVVTTENISTQLSTVPSTRTTCLQSVTLTTAVLAAVFAIFLHVGLVLSCTKSSPGPRGAVVMRVATRWRHSGSRRLLSCHCTYNDINSYYAGPSIAEERVTGHLT